MKHIHIHALLLLSCASLLPCTVVLAAGGGRREAQALLKWKASLAGGDACLSSWTLLPNTTGPCSWEFISCNSAGDVTGLMITGAGIREGLNTSLNGTLAGLDFSAFPRLENLYLSQNNLHGSIPEGIGNLTSLVSLEISLDSITGPIPRSIGKLKQLTVLRLDVLELDCKIPDEIGNLTGLEELELSGSGLTGSIPPAIGKLDKLTSLGLRSNSLSGSIPPEIGNMSELLTMNLLYNHLEGALPSTLSRLRKLGALLLSNNQLGGHLGSQLGNNSNLIQIDISSNNFTKVSAQSICRGGSLIFFQGNNYGFASMQDLNFLNCTLLGNLELELNSILGDIRELLGTLPSQIETLYLAQNQLHGALPLELGKFLKLDSLFLEENKITGEIPPTVGNLTNLSYLNLGYNLLTGPIPLELGSLSNILSLDLSNNQLSGPVPLQNLSELLFLDLSNCNLTGHAYDLFTGPHSNFSTDISFPNVEVLALSSNYFTGPMPIFLCNNTNLQVLDMSDNNLSGELLDCLWNLPLFFLDLSNNYFSGVVPFSSSSNMISLLSLHLANNHLRGNFPSVVRNCNDLITLDLGGNSFIGEIPSWIAGSLPKLRFLRLSSNMFDGTIPKQILHFRKLQLLDLSHNKLIGPIPINFANFSGMIQEQESLQITYEQGYSEQIQLVWKNDNYVYSKMIAFITGIDLSCNSLSQGIPDGLTGLHRLRFLNFSRNNLSGDIPKDFGNLTLLESLDLSWNHLEGQIPQSFADLKSLSILNLSYNGLFGRIPTGNQLQTLVDPSIYSNNPGLCGFPLKECANASATTQSETRHDGDSRERLWLYCFVVVGFIFGFWLSWGVLFCKATWRYALYLHVDNMQEKVAKKMKRKPCGGKTSGRRE